MIEAIMLWFLQIPSLALITIVAIETILLVIIFSRIPTKAFLGALRGRVLALVTRKDGRRDLIAADLDAGVLNLKEYGLVQISENSVTTLKKGGIPLVEVHTDYGATIPPIIAHGVQRLREMGFKNINQAELANFGYYTCLKCKKDVFLDVIPTKEVDDEGKPKVSKEGKQLLSWNVTYDCPGCKNNDKEQFEKAEWNIGLPAEGINFQKLSGFFKTQLNPILLQSMVERKLDEERQLIVGGGKMKWVTIGIMVFLACLGISVLYMFVNSAGSTCLQQCESLFSAAQAIGPTLQG